MKRKFSVIGFSFVFSMLLSNYLFEKSIWVLAVIVSVFLILSRRKKANKSIREIRLSLFSMLAACLLFSVYSKVMLAPAQKYTNKKTEIEGTVISECIKGASGNYRCTVKTSKINGEKCSLRIILYTPENIAALPGYTVKYTSYPFEPGFSDGGFGKYYLSKRIVLGTYTKYGVVIENNASRKNSLYITVLNERMKSEKIIRRFLTGDYAEFSNGILFGDKAYLSGERYSSFKSAGLSHIIAVSGLHMTVWVYGMYYILRRIRLRKRISAAICVGLSFFVMLFSSFSPSVVRAFIMISVYFGGIISGRKSDALNSLGFSAFVILCINPFSVCDPSFLLSFFATLGILTCSYRKPAFLKKGKTDGNAVKLLKNSGNIIFCSLAAGAFSYPASVNFFGHIPVYSWLANLFCVSMLTPCLVLSGLLTAFPTLDTLYVCAAWVLRGLESYIFFVCDKVSALPFSYPEMSNLLFTKIIPFAVTVIFLFLYRRRRKRADTVTLLTGLCLAAALLTG